MLRARRRGSLSSRATERVRSVGCVRSLMLLEQWIVRDRFEIPVHN